MKFGYVLKIALLAALYFGVAKIGLLFASVEGNVSLVWPPTGLALATLLLFGSHLWPGVAIGAFLATASTGAPLGFILATTIGNSLEALAGAYLMYRVGFDPRLTRVRDVVSLIFLGAGLSPILSATIGVTGLCLTGLAPWPAYLSIWWLWWVGDAMGILLIAPVLLTWTSRPSLKRAWQYSQWSEAGGVLLTGLSTSLIVFGSWPSSEQVHLAFVYLPFPALLWAALRFGPAGAATMNLVVNAIAMLGTTKGSGPFAQGTLNESLFLLWVFMGIASVTSLVTAAITAERQQAKAALQEIEVRYRSVVEELPVLVCRFEPGGIITFINQMYCQYFGKTLEEMTGQNFLSFIPEKDRQVVQANLAALSRESPVLTHEHRVIAPGGQIRWQRWTNQALFDAAGRPLAYQAFGLDITEQRRVEAERDVIFQRNQALVQALGEVVYEWWPLRNEVDWNGDYERILGYSPAEMGNDTDSWVSRLHPDDLERSLQEVGDASKERRPYNLEYRFRRRDGDYIWMHDQGILFHNPQGELERVIGLLRDITERKQAEAVRQKLEAQLLQAQKMEAIGRLAGGIAHDFNNILVPIIGYTELALMELSPDDKLYLDLQRVRAAAERAAGLTRQILAFSRQQVLEIHNVLDLNEIIIDFEKMIQRLIGEDIEFQTFLAPNIYPIKADKGQIEQVLMNLAVNARDAMPTGGKLTFETANVYLDEVEVEKYPDVQDPGYYVMLAVSDTGHGMDAETQQQIFEPFFTTKEQGKGTGLGLATVFGIVKQHGGNIRVYSEPGKGTIFKLYLPQLEGAAQRSTATSEPASI